MLTNYISVTELSRITKKSRPTLYKYIHDYEMGLYDGIPYSFLQLLKYSESDSITKKDILSFCEQNFVVKTDHNLIREIVFLLQENAANLNLEEIKENIKKEIQKNGTKQ